MPVFGWSSSGFWVGVCVSHAAGNKQQLLLSSVLFLSQSPNRVFSPSLAGKEVGGVSSPRDQGKYVQGGSGEDESRSGGSRRDCSLGVKRLVFLPKDSIRAGHGPLTCVAHPWLLLPADWWGMWYGFGKLCPGLFSLHWGVLLGWPSALWMSSAPQGLLLVPALQRIESIKNIHEGEHLWNQ